MTNTTNPPVSFPTSSSPIGSTADYRDSTVARASMQAHDAVDRVAGKVGPIVDQVKDAAGKASDMLSFQDFRFDEFQERSVAALRVSVRKRPVASVVMAMAAGFMLSRML